MAFGFKKILASFDTSKTAPIQNVVGIDIGSSSIKVVEVELGKQALKLKTYGELQLGPYANAPLGSSVTLPEEKKTEAVVDILREAKVSTSKGILALPLSGSFITVISLNVPATENIAPRIPVEARKHIPVPLSDVSFEWTEIEPLQNSPGNVRDILIAAIQKTTIEESNNILKSIEMDSQPSEIELFSTLRGITKDSDDALAIIDFGAKTSKLYIAEGGYLRKIHRVSSGGSHATERLSQMLSVSFEEAENIKRNYTASDTHATDVKKAMTTTFERTLQEFKRVLGQYEVRSGKSFSRIVLAGGVASFPDFAGFADYALDAKTTKANPFTKIAYPAFMEDVLIDIAPTFSVALGAALRPFEN